ncbi:ATP-binding cassette domain-containing protein [Paenibacillus daejeonensis]|uniref:ATP-binding cassette domain-containing protein n=1 Tax=Paenibacillus daejeonensis TaxID=135193 RepID=UPI0003633902|nr:ABC transporter ATP-binding protein [Paenibacillus daejeonensis]
MTVPIHLDRVSYRYDRRSTAIRNISLELPGPRIYGLIGRNGAGKSTLLSLLASYTEPDEGRVTIDGEAPFENTRIMPMVVFAHQTDYSNETDHVKALLESAARYRPNFDMAYAEQLAKRFKLPMKTVASKLSSGKQSALNATLALAARAPITIFDETYVGMDAPAREIFYREVMEDYERHPRTIILSTHLVSEMDYLFEDVIIIHQGKLLLHEPIDQLLERGVSVTGPAAAVDAFAAPLRQLSTQQLGGTKSVMVYGTLSEEQHQQGRTAGLEIGHVSLQELFIHLTEEEEEPS